MQPERRRESSERTGIARARMYLKSDLDWLEGFPIAQGAGFVEWQPKPNLGDVLPQRLRVDRERLTRTQLTLTKLVNRFPRAMPKVVGDVEAWRLRVNSVLDRLKEAIHGGADLLHQQRWPMDLLPRSQADSLDRWLASNPSLQSVARAVIGRRGRHGNSARDAAMLLCRELLSVSASELAKVFGVSASGLSMTVQRAGERVA